MPTTGTVKVPDGKLVEVTLAAADPIEDVRLTGDFFLEPPSARADLEAAIAGHPTDVDRKTLLAAIEGVDARLIGFDADHLAAATLEAIP